MHLCKIKFGCNQYLTDELLSDDIIDQLNSEEIVFMFFQGKNNFYKILSRFGVGFVKNYNLEFHAIV